MSFREEYTKAEALMKMHSGYKVTCLDWDNDRCFLYIDGAGFIRDENEASWQGKFNSMAKDSKWVIFQKPLPEKPTLQEFQGYTKCPNCSCKFKPVPEEPSLEAQINFIAQKHFEEAGKTHGSGMAFVKELYHQHVFDVQSDEETIRETYKDLKEGE